MLTTFAILAAIVVLLVGIALAVSPGKLRRIVDASGRPVQGSISEKLFVDINGTSQGMIIQGRDRANPVLLYLHGGMPEYFLSQRNPTGLEDYFTVCWWEQRGHGISYDSSQSPRTLTLDQAISDTLAVSRYLSTRFGQERIYLMGHSGGSFVGIQAAARAPEMYRAYIGVAQMTNQLKSENLAYEYMLARFRELGNVDMVRRLERAPVTLEAGTPPAYLALRDEAMHPLGIGTMHDMHSVITGIVLPSFTNPQYTLAEKVRTWRAKARSGVSPLWPEILRTDLNRTLRHIDLPVYFLEGIYDYTVSYAEARAYFRNLKARIKGFYTFDRSAHSPIFEEPERTCEIITKDVLHGTTRLADPD